MANQTPTEPKPGQTPGEPPKDEGLAAPWSELGKGTFSGIDYDNIDNAQGLDGYFVWADLNGFAHLRKPGQAPEDLSHVPDAIHVLLELSPKYSVADLYELVLAQVIERKLDARDMAAVLREGAGLTLAAAYLPEGGRKPPRGQVLPAIAERQFFNQFAASARLRALIHRVELDVPRAALLAGSAAPKDKPNTNAPAAQSSAKENYDATIAQQTDSLSKPTPSGNKPPRELLCGKVFAFIDDGCAFAHPHFLRGSVAGGNLEPRVKRLWDQNIELAPPASGASLSPIGFGYGREFTGDDLVGMIAAHTRSGHIDEDQLYNAFAAGTQDNIHRLNRRAAHGTHIMDLACGPYVLEDTMCTQEHRLPNQVPVKNPVWQAAGDDASNADIIFVQLPMPAVQNTSGSGAMAMNVLDALNYIMGQCDEHAHVVVNLSWGTLAGPHNGSSVLERGIDKLITEHGGRLSVVIPAGNGYQSRTHAYARLAAGASQTLGWRVQPDDATESYLEIYTEHPSKLRITITLPDGSTLPPKDSDSMGIYQPRPGVSVPTLALTYLPVVPPVPPMVDHTQTVLIAIAPTVSLDNLRDTALHGLWRVNVQNLGPGNATVDAYIERDDVALGTQRGARQSYFEDPNYDAQAKVDNHKSSPYSNPAVAYVRREGVFNSMATGRKTVVVGGLRLSDKTAAAYSPRRPYSPGQFKRQHTPEYRNRPIYYANSEESRTLHGVRAAGPRAGSSVRLSGTSDAAPQVARTLFNALPKLKSQALRPRYVIPKVSKW